jgi:hypothetical protein
LEDGKIKEFRRLLTTLEANDEQDQLGERDRLLERNRQVYRFLGLKNYPLEEIQGAFVTDRMMHLLRGLIT